MSDSHDDLWFVQLEGGAVRAMTLDELDAAFQAGSIDESTPVRHDASSAWAPLADVLAGSDEPAAAPVAATPVVEAAPASVPPISAPPPPVVSELADLDLDAPQFAGSKKRTVAAVLGLVAVLGAVGVTATRVAGKAAAANQSANITAALPSPAAPSEATGASDPSLANVDGPRLSDEQRRLLLDNDKKREAEAAKKRSERPTRGPAGSSRPIKIGDPIQKGGSKYDPLNGSL